MHIYHNPRCSKSRAALAFLQQNGAEPEVINYLKTPLQQVDIERIIEKLDVAASNLLRDKTDDAALDNDTIIRTLLAEPKRLQRPIIENATRAIIARPPERAAEFIKA